MAIDRVLERVVLYKTQATSLSFDRARVDLSVHEYVLSFHEVLVLLSSDRSRLPIRGKLSF